MPTYEYVCRSCGTHVEVFQRFNDPPLTDCGVCGGPLRKVFHPAGILFKGSGFYATDSRAGGSKREAKEGAEVGTKVGESKAGSSKGGSSKDGSADGASAKGDSTRGGPGRSKDSSGSSAKEKSA